jgi:hypothetical protein
MARKTIPARVIESPLQCPWFQLGVCRSTGATSGDMCGSLVHPNTFPDDCPLPDADAVSDPCYDPCQKPGTSCDTIGVCAWKKCGCGDWSNCKSGKGHKPLGLTMMKCGDYQPSVCDGESCVDCVARDARAYLAAKDKGEGQG